MRRALHALSPWREPLRMLAAIVLVPIVIVAAILVVGRGQDRTQNRSGACWGQFQVLEKKLAVGDAPVLTVQLQYSGTRRCSITTQAPGVQLVGDAAAAAGPFFPDGRGSTTITAGQHPVLSFSIRAFLACRAAAGDAYRLRAFLGPHSRASDGAPVAIMLGPLSSAGDARCGPSTPLGAVSPLR